MQLSARTQRGSRPLGGLALSLLITSSAGAQSGEATVTTSVFHEARGPLSSTIIAPAVSAEIAPIDTLAIDVGWDVDIVSAASVAVVDAPGVDVVSSATLLTDVRNAGHLGATLTLGDVTASAQYGYGWESDYRAHALSLGGSVELFERSTRIVLSYALTADEVCDVVQLPDATARDRVRLPNSAGCFTSMRATREAASHTIDLGLVQALRPDLIVRVAGMFQRLTGFQSSPYREVWIGPWAAQEHHPDGRTRGSLSIEARLAIADLSGTLRGRIRGYHDDWDMSAISGELSWEQRMGPEWRLRLHGRAFTQSAVAFFSDDYANAPRGEYFTGDRELSAMSSLGGGLRLSFAPAADEQGRVLGVLEGLTVSAGIEATRSEYPGFHYSSEGVPDGAWILASLAVQGEI